MGNKNKIIILTYYYYPCTEPVLENVFAKELGKKHDIMWLMQGDISKGKIRKWHNSTVFLTKKIRENARFSKVRNKILRCHKLWKLLCLLWEGDIKIVVVRDLPFIALLIVPLRHLFGFKLYFQFTAPLGDMNIALSKYNKSGVRLITRSHYFFLGYLFNLFSHYVLKTADLVFPITDFHKKELLSFTHRDKLIPITMGVDEDWIKNIKP